MIKDMIGMGQIFSFVFLLNANEELFIATKIEITHTKEHGPGVTPKD